MKPLSRIPHPPVLLSALLAAGALFAVADMPAASAATPPAATAKAADTLPPELQYAGIHYVTGGVGVSEAKAFRAAEHQYPLAIELAAKQKGAKHDALTAGAQIRIADDGGKEIFNAEAKGPFMLIRLDPGRYSLTATLDGHTVHKRHFTVGSGKSTRETVVFPATAG